MDQRDAKRQNPLIRGALLQAELRGGGKTYGDDLSRAPEFDEFQLSGYSKSATSKRPA